MNKHLLSSFVAAGALALCVGCGKAAEEPVSATPPATTAAPASEPGTPAQSMGTVQPQVAKGADGNPP